MAGEVVTVAELQRYMRREFDETDALEATALIAAAQSELEAFLGRPITVRTFTDVTIRAPGTWTFWRRGDLVFPHTPVVSIASITADGASQSLTGLDVRSWGIASYDGSFGLLGTIVATFDAGLAADTDPTLAALKLTVLRRAAREMTARLDATQGTERVVDEGYEADAVAADGGYTPSELRSVRRFKRRIMAA